jgi:hypothetical protein
MTSEKSVSNKPKKVPLGMKLVVGAVAGGILQYLYYNIIIISYYCSKIINI